MKKKTHLFLALGRLGWGEAALGIHIAEELYQKGERCIFVVYEYTAPLFKTAPFPYELISDHMGPLFQLWLDSFIGDHHVGSIVLCDFFTTTTSLETYHIKPGFLTGYDCPVIAIDTWDYKNSGSVLDFAHNETKRIPPWIEQLPLRLLPVPFIRPEKRKGIYASPMAKVSISGRTRRQIRANLNIPDDHKIILFCSADWQHTEYANQHCLRLRNELPVLMAFYINQLGNHVHLVHVGMQKCTFDALLGDRYHWLNKLNAKDFETLFGSIDLFLSANISARSLTRAIVSGIPAIVLSNSHMINSMEEVDHLENPNLPSFLVQWIRKALPIYPFHMWPLGFYNFLKPILKANPYMETICVADLLDSQKVIQSLNDLLFNQSARDEMRNKQEEYLTTISALPMASDYINDFLNN
jgi:hypothetical protein